MEFVALVKFFTAEANYGQIQRKYSKQSNSRPNSPNNVNFLV